LSWGRQQKGESLGQTEGPDGETKKGEKEKKKNGEWPNRNKMSKG